MPRRRQLGFRQGSAQLSADLKAGAPLLDSRLLLWLAAAPERLPAGLAKDLSDRKNPFCFSMASLWEVAIKASLGRTGFAVDVSHLRLGLLRGGFHKLAIEAEHCLTMHSSALAASRSV